MPEQVNTDVKALLSIEQRARAPEQPALLVSALQAARRLVQPGRGFAVLNAVLVSSAAVDEVRSRIERFDHVGLVVPAQSLEEASDAATEAGFDELHHVFPSMVLSRELSELYGAPVPMKVLKARGRSDDGEAETVELFIPTGVELESIRAWMPTPAGRHAAFAVKRRNDLEAITPILEAHGFRVPAFMRGGPLTNTVEDVTTAYFDGTIGLGEPMRLEFCYYG